MGASTSFSARLSGRILLITSILYIIAITIIAIATFRSISDESLKSTDYVLEATKLNIEKTLEKVEDAAKTTAWLAAYCIDDTNKLYFITAKVVTMNSDIVGCAVALDSSYSHKKYLSPYSFESPTGEVKSIELGNDQYDYYSMEWYQAAKELKQARWCKPYFDEGGGGSLMTTYSIPLQSKTGEVYGIVTSDLSLHELSMLIANTRPYKNAYTVLLDKDGTIIANGRSALTPEVDDDNEINDSLRRAMCSGKKGTMQFVDDVPVFAAYGALNNGWSIAVVCPYKDVFAHTMKMNNVFILVSIAAMLLLLILCMKTIKRLLQPVTELSVAALNMAKGNFNAHLPEIQTHDELRKLHDSMAYMQKSIISYIHELRTTSAANERMESELNIARSIQLGMVPRNFTDFLHAALKPAREVGGDLYDFFVKDRKLYFAIGDVSGKGVPAALYMAITRAAFRFIANMDIPMNEVMKKINDSLSQANETNMFVTMFIASLDLDTGEMEFCNAGHNPIMIIPPANSANPHAFFLKVKPNLATGLMENFNYEVDHFTLEKGSRIVLYTDGISEAETMSKELFGDDRLLAWAESRVGDGQTPQQMVDHLLEHLTSFTNGAEQNDDITMMAITY